MIRASGGGAQVWGGGAFKCWALQALRWMGEEATYLPSNPHWPYNTVPDQEQEFKYLVKLLNKHSSIQIFVSHWPVHRFHWFSTLDGLIHVDDNTHKWILLWSTCRFAENQWLIETWLDHSQSQDHTTHHDIIILTSSHNDNTSNDGFHQVQPFLVCHHHWWIDRSSPSRSSLLRFQIEENWLWGDWKILEVGLSTPSV